MTEFGPYILDCAGRSDIGRQRETNQDALLLLAHQGVFCVADGVGGGAHGELASAAVVRELGAAFDTLPGGTLAGCDPEALAREAINRASAWINTRAWRPEHAGMATTVVALLFSREDPGMAVALHAGDSRCYRMRGGSLRLLTRDHSGAELLGAIDSLMPCPEYCGNMITRAVGTHPAADLERTVVGVRPGDVFLLCSDGLNRMLPDAVLAAQIEGTADTECLAESLIEAANAGGGTDNITAIVVRVGTR